MSFMDYLEKRLAEKDSRKTTEKKEIVNEEKKETSSKTEEQKKEITIEEQIQDRINTILENAGEITAPKEQKKSQEITDMINKLLG